MKRKELLISNDEKANFDTLVSSELRDFRKVISDIEYELQVERDKLRETMSGKDPISKSTVLSSYSNIKNLEDELKLYKGFVKEYYAE